MNISVRLILGVQKGIFVGIKTTTYEQAAFYDAYVVRLIYVICTKVAGTGSAQRINWPLADRHLLNDKFLEPNNRTVCRERW